MTIAQTNDGYRTSSFSANGENCVEVKDLPVGARMVRGRDSKNRVKPAHFYTATEWQAFIAGVKAGEFD